MLWRLQCHQTGLFRQVTINQLFKPHYYTSSVVHYPICVAPSTVSPILCCPTCLAPFNHQVHQTAPQLQLNCSETLSHKTWHILPWFLCCTGSLCICLKGRTVSLLDKGDGLWKNYWKIGIEDFGQWNAILLKKLGGMVVSRVKNFEGHEPWWVVHHQSLPATAL